MPEHRHQQHALGGAEVAAVHAGEQHRRPHPPGAVLAAARRSPRGGAPTHAEIRGWKTTSTRPSRISAGTIAAKAPAGSTSSSRRAGEAADQRGDAEPQHPARAGRPARGGSRRRRRPSRAPARSVLDTLAVTGGTPNASRVGNVISVPDPTTVLMVPAASPARRIAAASSSVTGRRVPPARRRSSARRVDRRVAGPTAAEPLARVGGALGLGDRRLDGGVGLAQLAVRVGAGRTGLGAAHVDARLGALDLLRDARAGRSSSSRGPRAPCRSRSARSRACWRRPRRSSASSGGTGRPAATGRGCRRGWPGRPSGWPGPRPGRAGSRTPGRPGPAGSATRGHPRR